MLPFPAMFGWFLNCISNPVMLETAHCLRYVSYRRQHRSCQYYGYQAAACRHTEPNPGHFKYRQRWLPLDRLRSSNLVLLAVVLVWSKGAARSCKSACIKQQSNAYFISIWIIFRTGCNVLIAVLMKTSSPLQYDTVRTGTELQRLQSV